MTNTNRLKVMFGLLLALIVSGIGAAFYLVQTTRSDIVQGSLFSEDICTPPCWFGLTAGESTSTDIETALSRFDNIFNYWNTYYYDNIFDEQEHLIYGNYEVYWAEVGREDITSAQNYLWVEAGIITWMEIQPNRHITLAQTLEILGQPDEVRLGVEMYQRYIEFIYFAPHLRVSLTTHLETCNLSDIRRDFWIHELRYFSPDRVNTPYPSLLAEITRERIIPTEEWMTWLNNGENQECLDAWESLPESTPALTATN